VHISANSIASLFQELQSLASGSATSSSFGAQMTGQNLPTPASGASSTSSLGASPLAATPSSQFASDLLSALVSAQQSPPSAQTIAGQIISAINPNGNGSLSLSQVEQSLTGSSATTSPQQQAIAGAYAQLDANGDGSLSQGELASALQSLQQQSDPTQAMAGHHHHHHHMQAETAADTTSSTSGVSSTSSDAAAVDATASVTTPAVSAAA
jgi:hypothetical protein